MLTDRDKACASCACMLCRVAVLLHPLLSLAVELSQEDHDDNDLLIVPVVGAAQCCTLAIQRQGSSERCKLHTCGTWLTA